VGRPSSSLYAHDAVAGSRRSVELSHLRRQGAAGHTLAYLFSRHEQSLLTRAGHPSPPPGPAVDTRIVRLAADEPRHGQLLPHV
jgi:hypothetical protein